MSEEVTTNMERIRHLEADLAECLESGNWTSDRDRLVAEINRLKEMPS
jgi:hypothetical protein